MFSNWTRTAMVKLLNWTKCVYCNRKSRTSNWQEKNAWKLTHVVPVRTEEKRERPVTTWMKSAKSRLCFPPNALSVSDQETLISKDRRPENFYLGSKKNCEERLGTFPLHIFIFHKIEFFRHKYRKSITIQYNLKNFLIMKKVFAVQGNRSLYNPKKDLETVRIMLLLKVKMNNGVNTKSSSFRYWVNDSLSCMRSSTSTWDHNISVNKSKMSSLTPG